MRLRGWSAVFQLPSVPARTVVILPASPRQENPGGATREMHGDGGKERRESISCSLSTPRSWNLVEKLFPFLLLVLSPYL